jgi:hypothetical protein
MLKDYIYFAKYMNMVSVGAQTFGCLGALKNDNRFRNLISILNLILPGVTAFSSAAK